jgi:hypothetical protein
MVPMTLTDDNSIRGPRIDPLPEGTARTLFSVMIPVSGLPPYVARIASLLHAHAFTTSEAAWNIARAIGSAVHAVGKH